MIRGMRRGIVSALGRKPNAAGMRKIPSAGTLRRYYKAARRAGRK